MLSKLVQKRRAQDASEMFFLLRLLLYTERVLQNETFTPDKENAARCVIF
jgi:hypothetical protein